MIRERDVALEKASYRAHFTIVYVEVQLICGAMDKSIYIGRALRYQWCPTTRRKHFFFTVKIYAPRE